MLLKRSACGGGVSVALEQSLRQGTVVETVSTQKVGDDGFVSAIGHKVLYGFAFILKAGVIKFPEESELFYVVKKGLLKRGGGDVIGCVQETEKILEHAAGGTGCRYELGDDVLAACAVGIPGLDVLGCLTLIECYYTVADGCGGIQLQERETVLYELQLCFYFFGCCSLLFKLFQIFLVKHIYKWFVSPF